MTQLSIDISFLKQALDLATIRRGETAPNPSVGSVIVNSKHQLISTGYHLGSGHSHAEIDAFNNAPTNADLHTLYVTLEPCCHVGKTPPCTDAIIRSGISRVVYAYKDPNPIVNGRGQTQLTEAGIQCDFVSIPEIDAFYASYAYWHQHQRPFVTAKLAMTLDGYIAECDGNPIRITGQVLQAFTHAQRKMSDAILSTARTIIADDPQLNVRIQQTVSSKPIYLLDTALQLPLNAQLFKTAKSITVFHANDASELARKRLSDQGVRCIPIHHNQHGLDLQQVLTHVGQDGIHDLWVEAGGRCFSAFIQQQLLQRAYLYIAPMVLGQGLPAFRAPLNLMQTASKIRWQPQGDDVFCEIHW